MHRQIRDQIEDVLAGSQPSPSLKEHLASCPGCRAELDIMRRLASALRELRPAEEIQPRPGFYARVLERLEAQGPVSIWNLFIESPFGRRIAVAATALVLLAGFYLASLDRNAQEPVIAGGATAGRVQIIPGEDGPARVISSIDQTVDQGLAKFDPAVTPAALTPGMDSSSQDAVLVNLVTYQEQ